MRAFEQHTLAGFSIPKFNFRHNDLLPLIGKPQNMNMLVKYPCGCIGLPPQNPEQKATGEGIMILLSCAQAEPSFHIYCGGIRNPEDWEPLTEEDERERLIEAGKLMFDGHRFRELKNLLAD